MGLLAHIYKAGSNCSNGGISETASEVCILNVSGPFDPSDTRPAVLLVPGNLKGIAKIVPKALADAGRWTIFGGCYVATSDSRFTEAVEQITGARFSGAVPLHDRVE